MTSPEVKGHTPGQLAMVRHIVAIPECSELAQAIAFLEANKNLELSHRHDFCEDDPVWQVHAVTGGRNDREWTMIGEGETIIEAINAARSTLETVDSAISRTGAA